MSAALSEPMAGGERTSLSWVLAGVGYLAMYLPTYWFAANRLWNLEEHSHGALMLTIAAWLFWQVRGQIARSRHEPAIGAGSLLFGLGVAAYVIGRTFTVSSVELASQMFVVAGGLLLMGGPAALRAAWFPVLFLAFVIPLPSTVVDAMTGPLKQWVSSIVESLLYAGGYPVAREGVVIHVGSYQLLVADACSGLNSIISLSALGSLYVYLSGRPAGLHNALMLVAIVPVAFLANVVRVIVLVLLTYYLGDEAGQGFLHGGAGFALALISLAALFALDRALASVRGIGRGAGSHASDAGPGVHRHGG